MCRGFQENERDRLLKIKAFYVSLSLSKTPNHLPDSLTLHYLPRINGGPLEINGSVIRPHAPVFVSLYRVVSDDGKGKGKGSVMYGSRDRVRVSEGVRFEVYLREEKAVKGSFRKDEGGEWKMECKCGLEGEVEVEHVDVCVAAEGEGEAMKERVEMVVKRRKRGMCFVGLEEIPEQRSEGEEVEEYCCCCGGDCTGEDGAEAEAEEEGGVEVEGVKWAVDVGILVCLGVGVGYLVSKASSKSLRRRRLL